MSIREQLDDIRTEIKHQKSIIETCQGKTKLLQATMKQAREKIKELREKRRKLIFSTVGVKIDGKGRIKL